MKVLITGATGMVGSLVLQNCLENNQVDKVVCLTRRSTNIKHAKLDEIIVDDFLALDEQAPYFEDLDAVYYCLGVYTGAVGRDEFRTVTVDYTEVLASIIAVKSPQARFCLLSGGGADRTEKSRMAFAKDKGAIENRLSKMRLGEFYAFRPGYIYPVTSREEPNFSYRLSRWFYPIIRLFGKKFSIRSTDLAQAIVRTGLVGHKLEILENRDIVSIINPH